jgi:hypothetical protein
MASVFALALVPEQFAPILDGRQTFIANAAIDDLSVGDLLEIIEGLPCEYCNCAGVVVTEPAGVKIRCRDCKGTGTHPTGYRVTTIVKYVIKGPTLAIADGAVVASIEVVGSVTPGIDPGREPVKA